MRTVPGEPYNACVVDKLVSETSFLKPQDLLDSAGTRF